MERLKDVFCEDAVASKESLFFYQGKKLKDQTEISGKKNIRQSRSIRLFRQKNSILSTMTFYLNSYKNPLLTLEDATLYSELIKFFNVDE